MNTQDFKRKLTAVFSADVAGYSRLMGEDEAATVRTVETYKQVMFSLIKQHRGRVIDSPGDNILAEFASVVDAVQCGVAVQKELQARNANLPENRKMQFRIGINLGDVIEEADRIYGDGVNIAARLEALASPGGICVSKTAFDHIESKLPLGYEYLGEQTVKNIAKPVGAYRVAMEPRVTVVGIEEKKAPSKQHRVSLAIAVIVILLVGVLGLWQFVLRQAPPSVEKADPKKMAFALPDKPSIAVLPFANISEDPKQEVFSDGLTEEIITAISKSPNLFVIARTSAFTYKGKPAKIKQVSEDLGVRYVLEGSVRREGERIRITAQFIDAMSGHHLWSERFDRDLKDIFAVQEEIAAKIMKALQVRLPSGDRGGPTGRGTKNVEAYLKVMEGAQLLFRYTKEDNAVARKLLEEAINLDPDYARAYSVLGVCLANDVMLGLSKSPKESLERAIEMGQKSLTLDGSDAHANSIVAYLYAITRRFDKAVVKAERALTLDPNSFSVLNNSAFALTFAGKPDQAIPLLEKAIRLDPRASAAPYMSLNMAYLMVGRYEDALEAAKKAVERNPRFLAAQIRLAIGCVLAGRDEEARAVAAEILKINPKFSIEEWTKTVPIPIKDQTYIDRFADALRKAGLPDKPPLPLPDKPSIAVLPFVNMSGDPKEDYFSDGLTEQIITSLSMIPRLFVIARNSTFVYKGKAVKVQKVAEELGVRYVLEGGVQKSEDRVRITVQLIDAIKGNHLWSERYDRQLKDLFALQDEIVRQIMTAVQVELTEGQFATAIAGSTSNLKALECYWRALECANRWSGEDNAAARHWAERAIELDPNFAGAWAQLGLTHLLDATQFGGKSPAQSLKRAEECAQKALSINDSTATALSLMAGIRRTQGKWDEAVEYGEKALAINPNDPSMMMSLALTIHYLGRFDEAISLTEKAMRICPYYPAIYLPVLAASYVVAGRYQEAVKACELMLNRSRTGEINPLFAHVFLAEAYVGLDQLDKARAQAEEVLKIDPKFSLEREKRLVAFKDPVIGERRLAALRKAGLK
jgi:adenylate cyclase